MVSGTGAGPGALTEVGERGTRPGSGVAQGMGRLQGCEGGRVWGPRPLGPKEADVSQSSIPAVSPCPFDFFPPILTVAVSPPLYNSLAVTVTILYFGAPGSKSWLCGL